MKFNKKFKELIESVSGDEFADRMQRMVDKVAAKAAAKKSKSKSKSSDIRFIDVDKLEGVGKKTTNKENLRYRVKTNWTPEAVKRLADDFLDRGKFIGWKVDDWDNPNPIITVHQGTPKNRKLFMKALSKSR
jgi:hypothetical protein